MKFKIGDKVRVKNGLVGGKTYDKIYFGYCMEPFRGKDFIIEKVINHKCGYILNDGEGFFYGESMLEPVENAIPEKLIIYREDNKTIAKYYKSDKTVTAEANCAPEDEFDFEYGAKLAMDRAIEKMKEEETGYSWVKCVGYRQNEEFYFTVDERYKVYDDGRIVADNEYVYGGKNSCNDSKEKVMDYLAKWYIFEEVN